MFKHLCEIRYQIKYLKIQTKPNKTVISALPKALTIQSVRLTLVTLVIVFVFLDETVLGRHSI